MSRAGALLERNLSDVFGQRDPTSRAAVIAELYTSDCVFHEGAGDIVGQAALNKRVGELLAEGPNFVFRSEGRAETIRDLERLRWTLGPAAGPPIVRGMDIALIDGGRIRALYTFIEATADHQSA